MRRLLHLRIDLPERAVRAAPDALPEDAGVGHRGEERRREQDVVDLLRGCAVPEGPDAAIARVLRVRADVPELRALVEKGSERRGLWRIVQVSDHGDELDSLCAPLFVDRADSLRLPLAPCVRRLRSTI